MWKQGLEHTGSQAPELSSIPCLNAVLTLRKHKHTLMELLLLRKKVTCFSSWGKTFKFFDAGETLAGLRCLNNQQADSQTI
jgi:hypothetical protein